MFDFYDFVKLDVGDEIISEDDDGEGFINFTAAEYSMNVQCILTRSKSKHCAVHLLKRVERLLSFPSHLSSPFSY